MTYRLKKKKKNQREIRKYFKLNENEIPTYFGGAMKALLKRKFITLKASN